MRKNKRFYHKTYIFYAKLSIGVEYLKFRMEYHI